MSKVEKEGFDHDMEKTIANATKLGIGVAIVSRDALEDLIKKASKDSSVSEKEARKAVNDLVVESKRREEQLKKQVAHAIRVVKTKSPVVARKEVDKMKVEIAKLKEQLKKKKK